MGKYLLGWVDFTSCMVYSIQMIMGCVTLSVADSYCPERGVPNMSRLQSLGIYLLGGWISSKSCMDYSIQMIRGCVTLT